MDDLIAALKAVGEPTRLRIVAVLARSELTVSELCRILGQSQPRVSRHLKLLCDAGILRRHAQGSSAFFRPASTGLGRAMVTSIIELIDDEDPSVQGDLRRLAEIRAERAAAASDYFERIAGEWNAMRALHVEDAAVEAAMLSAVDDIEIGRLLDVGTGTGRVLEVFADRIDRGIGLDLSRQMLDAARSRLDEQGLRNCSVRQGNAYDIDIEPGSVDVAVLHHVLHFLDDPRACLAEVARTLTPGGRLLIVDFAEHTHESMRTDFSHHWLGFADHRVASWLEEVGLRLDDLRHLSLDQHDEDALTVTLWIASNDATVVALDTPQRNKAAS